ncbi:RHS repeat-associated core domain-containing protein [Akkermansia sp.]|uniref:RHS repeat-associated core domain-containing protein n=1 Tax=Akkermansia sp. TaxID=1872421 RepID=UPI003AB69695
MEKSVYEGESLVSRKRFLYRNYLQIAELDATDTTEEATPILRKTYLWDPMEPEATRILAMSLFDETGTYQEDLYYMHDFMKNTIALFGIQAGRRALYEYGPYGSVVKMEGNAAELNPFRFSSEYSDDELGLVYYNYRYLNLSSGRWISRDPIQESDGWNWYRFARNNSIYKVDFLGFAIFVLSALDPNDPQITGSQVKITPKDLKAIDNFLTDFDTVDEDMFNKSVKNKKVKFDGKEYNGTQADYRRKVVREKNSKTENVATGGLSAVIEKLKSYAKLATEDYDVLGLVAHGGYERLSDGGWKATGSANLAGVWTKMTEIENALNGIGKHVKWSSCFRDVKHKEVPTIRAARGKVNFGYKVTRQGGKEISKEKIGCVITFTPFNFSRYRAIEEGPDAVGKPEFVE